MNVHEYTDMDFDADKIKELADDYSTYMTFAIEEIKDSFERIGEFKRDWKGEEGETVDQVVEE